MPFAVHMVILSILFSQRLLPIDGANDLFFQPPPLTPTSKVYTIRPYFPKDEVTAFDLLLLLVVYFLLWQHWSLLGPFVPL